MHLNSRKLKTQRRNFALASQHYARLSPNQKAITRHQFEEVEYQTSHGKTDTKLLMGRQLFIAKDIHELNVAQREIKPPLEACIILVDPSGEPVEGELWLRYLKNGDWLECEKEQLSPLDWLFPNVPPGQEAYQVYGEAVGYLDPLAPEFLAMTEKQLKAHHYHQLIAPEYQYYKAISTGASRLDFYFMTDTTVTSMFLKTRVKNYEPADGVTIELLRYVGAGLPLESIQSHSYYTDPPKILDDYFYTAFTNVTITQNKWYYIWYTLLDHFTRGLRVYVWYGFPT